MQFPPDTMVGSALADLGIRVYPPPTALGDEAAEHMGMPGSPAQVSAIWGNVSKTPDSTVLFVTFTNQHHVIRTIDEALSVWRKELVWYIVVVRNDTLEKYRGNIGIIISRPIPQAA